MQESGGLREMANLALVLLLAEETLNVRETANMKTFVMWVFLAATVALTGLGCTTEDSSNSRTSRQESSEDQTPKKDEPAARFGETLALRIPSESFRPFAEVEISLRRTDCPSTDYYDWEDARPRSADGLSLHGEPEEVGSDASDPRQEDYFRSPDGDCFTDWQSERFQRTKEGNYFIGGLVAGYYYVTVRLFGEDGGIGEEGSNWAEVLPGQLNQAVVEIYPVDSAGGLDVRVIRHEEEAEPKPLRSKPAKAPQE